MNWTTLHDFPALELERWWREFLTRADFPTHYTSPEYFREPFFANLNPFVVLALDGERVIGVLSGVHKAETVECGIQWRPQISCDPAVDQGLVGERLLQGLFEEARDAKLLEVHSWQPMVNWQSHGFKVQAQEAAVVLDLTLGADPLFKQFAGTRRTDIRKAIKNNVEVSEATTQEDVASFHEIHQDWSRNKGFTPMSIEQLEQALNQRDNRRLFLARHEGRIIAGTILRFYQRGIVEYAANCSNIESLRLKPNDLLQWRAIEWACKEGFRRYSFGSTDPFMRKFGGEILPSYRYRLDRTLFHRHQLKEGLQSLAHKAFQALPTPVKNQIRHLRTRKGG